MRRTKLIATVGPALMPAPILKAACAEVDVFRLNLSHGSLEDHARAIQEIRAMAQALGRVIGVMIDLQGPKIRIGSFQKSGQDKGCVVLSKGADFFLDAVPDTAQGNTEGVSIEYWDLPHQVQPGDELLLDDGRITMRVKKIIEKRIFCEVLQGGLLSDHKGINKKGGGLSAPALTEKDKKDIQFAAEKGVDYVAVSFPKSAADLQEARNLLRAAGGLGYIVAKIERMEAIADLESLVAEADAVMVARGDLGVECGFAELPALQQKIIHSAQAQDKLVIVATQMMESMIHSSIPTRAEVADVAYAVLEGTDAVMLSAESASGEYPIETIQAMASICLSAEKQPAHRAVRERHTYPCASMKEVMAMAAVYCSQHWQGVEALIVLSDTGQTPLWISRMRVLIPIFAFSASAQTRGRISLMKGVIPILWDGQRDPIHFLREKGWISAHAHVLVTAGDAIRIIDIHSYAGEKDLWL